MTQRALATKARVSPGLIGQLEAGLRPSVDVQLAVRIAAYDARRTVAPR
jgi:transcriptional regulator with XRE-family HTH domain